MKALNYPITLPLSRLSWSPSGTKEWMDLLKEIENIPLSKIIREKYFTRDYLTPRGGGVNIRVVRRITQDCMCPGACLTEAVGWEGSPSRSQGCPRHGHPTHGFCFEDDCIYCTHLGRNRTSDFSSLRFIAQPFLTEQTAGGTETTKIGRTGILVATGWNWQLEQPFWDYEGIEDFLHRGGVLLGDVLGWGIGI